MSIVFVDDGVEDFSRCKPDCSKLMRWVLFAFKVKRYGCYDCEWCVSV